jgi:hypothetical protein
LRRHGDVKPAAVWERWRHGMRLDPHFDQWHEVQR